MHANLTPASLFHSKGYRGCIFCTEAKVLSWTAVSLYFCLHKTSWLDMKKLVSFVKWVLLQSGWEFTFYFVWKFYRKPNSTEWSQESFVILNCNIYFILCLLLNKSFLNIFLKADGTWKGTIKGNRRVSLMGRTDYPWQPPTSEFLERQTANISTSLACR